MAVRNQLPIVFFLLLSLAPPASADKVDDYIKDMMTKAHIPGLTLGIVENGKLTRIGAYGLADLELNVPTKNDTLFEIGSMTKQFTATAIMMLVEEGKVKLDEPIATYLGSVPDSWKPITVRQMLNHTSGLPEYATYAEWTLNVEYERDKMIEAMKKVPLDFAPGTAFSYSNLGYQLLGSIIEKVSGKTFDEVISERILKPLDMSHTRTIDPYDIVPNRAHGYLFDTKMMNAPHSHMGAAFSAGDLLSNVEDIAKWNASLDSKKLLKPESYAQMWTPLKLSSGRTRPYGFGYFLSPLSGHPVISHPGASSGYGGAITKIPDQNLTVIVLTNVYSGIPDRMTKDIASLLRPDLKAVKVTEAKDPNPELTKKLRVALDKLAAGDVDASTFTEDFRAPFLTSRGKMQAGGYRPFKDISTFAFVDAKRDGIDTAYRYHAMRPERGYVLTFTVAPDGKISNFEVAADPAG